MQDQGVELHSLMCKKIADLVKVVDKLFKSSHAAQLENVFLREELVEFEALKKENETLNETLDALQRKLREAEEKLKHECEQLKELHMLEMDKLREEMNCREEEFLDKLREKDHALSDMEHQLGLKTVQNKELQASLSECKKRYKMASSSGRDAKEEKDGLFSELVAVKSSMESMEEELEATRLEKDRLKRELEQHVERAGWEGEKCKLNMEVASLQDQVKKLQSQLLRMAHGSRASHASHEPSRSAHNGRVVGIGSAVVSRKAHVHFFIIACVNTLHCDLSAQWQNIINLYQVTKQSLVRQWIS